MRRLIQPLIAALLLAVFAAAADSPIAGTWTANLHDLPAIKMTVKDDHGKLSGSIIYYYLVMENGVWHVKGKPEPTEMINPHLEGGDTLVFDVPHARKHGSTDPADQEIKTMRFHITGKGEGVFHDPSGDLKLCRR